MANSATFALSFILLCSLFLIDDMPFASALDCAPGYECNFAKMAFDLHYPVPNRKFLIGLSKTQKRPNYGEYRKVPSGPNPINHEMGSPENYGEYRTVPYGPNPLHREISSPERRPNFGGEFRSVPSGPDPIHHQLGTPQRRPRNSP